MTTDWVELNSEYYVMHKIIELFSSPVIKVNLVRQQNFHPHEWERDVGWLSHMTWLYRHLNVYLAKQLLPVVILFYCAFPVTPVVVDGSHPTCFFFFCYERRLNFIIRVTSHTYAFTFLPLHYDDNYWNTIHKSGRDLIANLVQGLAGELSEVNIDHSFITIITFHIQHFSIIILPVI